MKKSLLMSFLVIGAVAAMITAATTALFSDTVTSNDNSFSTGTLLLSVDDHCGLDDTTSPRTKGGTTCERGVAFTGSNMEPGDSESHNYVVVNDGSVNGELTITVSAVSTGTCAVSVNDDTATEGWLVTYDVIDEVALAAGATLPGGWDIEVELLPGSDNNCQGESLDVDITFLLEQVV